MLGHREGEAVGEICGLHGSFSLVMPYTGIETIHHGLETGVRVRDIGVEGKAVLTMQESSVEGTQRKLRSQ